MVDFVDLGRLKVKNTTFIDMQIRIMGQPVQLYTIEKTAIYSKCFAFF